MRRSPALLVPLALCLSCVGEAPPQNPAPTVDLGEGGERPVGIYMVVPRSIVPSQTEAGFLAAPARRTIFVNKNGGTYSPGGDNSSSNRSSIVDYTSSVPGYEGSAADWNAFLTCIQGQFARFNVTVTDVDPGSEPHVEAVIGGRPGDIGMPSGVGGVAPMNGDCSVVERAVVYIFSKVFSSPRVECEVAAQEIGHALGMDHEYLCEDPMTYLSGCGEKDFQDIDASCGEYSPRSCMCGGSRQNSVQFLDDVLGPSDGTTPPPEDPPPGGTDTTPPAVAVVSPADGATSPPNTTITVVATASDETALASTELIWLVDSRTITMDCDDPPSGVSCTTACDQRSWSFAVGSGPRSFRVRAVDAAGNEAETATRTITLASGPTPPPPTGGAPTVTVTEPTPGTGIAPGASIAIRATATDDGRVVDAWLRWKAPSGDTIYQLYQLDATTWGIDLQLSSAATHGDRTIRVSVWDDDGTRTVAPDLVIQVE